MKTTAIIIGMLAVATGLAQARDITLESGRLLKNAEKIESGVDFVRIRYDDGIIRVNANDLPEQLRQEWDMMPEQVEERKSDRLEQQKIKKELEEQRIKEMRAALSEAEKQPRYVKGAEFSALFATLGGIEPVEAEYLANKWNIAEANRVGLPDQAQAFINNLAFLEPQIRQLDAERREAARQWEKTTEKMEQLAQQSQSQVNQLKQQVSQLRDDVQNSKNDYPRTIIYSRPVQIHTFDPPRPRPPIIIRPNPSPWGTRPTPPRNPTVRPQPGPSVRPVQPIQPPQPSPYTQRRSR